jgi:geranylgeranyl pyrophosphate synthase
MHENLEPKYSRALLGGAPRALSPTTRSRLGTLEDVLHSRLDRESYVPEPCRALLRGGKRLRATLLFISGEDDARPCARDLVEAALAIELVHAASLLHDDIVDACELRRGVPAAHRVLGTRRASLVGAYLVHLALDAIGRLPRAARVRFGEVGRRLARGQLTETVRARDLGLTAVDRLRIMEEKTASVFGLACELGALLGESGQGLCPRWRQFGASFGMLFQLADDVEDLFATREILGRRPGADLASGVISLPLALGLETPRGPELGALLTRPSGAREAYELAQAREILSRTGVCGRLEEMARSFATTALGALATLPASGDTPWLRALVESTLARASRWLRVVRLAEPACEAPC